jgi:hypothetical protein
MSVIVLAALAAVALRSQEQGAAAAAAPQMSAAPAPRRDALPPTEPPKPEMTWGDYGRTCLAGAGAGATIGVLGGPYGVAIGAGVGCVGMTVLAKLDN